MRDWISARSPWSWASRTSEADWFSRSVWSWTPAWASPRLWRVWNKVRATASRRSSAPSRSPSIWDAMPTSCLARSTRVTYRYRVGRTPVPDAAMRAPVALIGVPDTPSYGSSSRLIPAMLRQVRSLRRFSSARSRSAFRLGLGGTQKLSGGGAIGASPAPGAPSVVVGSVNPAGRPPSAVASANPSPASAPTPSAVVSIPGWASTFWWPSSSSAVDLDTEAPIVAGAGTVVMASLATAWSFARAASQSTALTTISLSLSWTSEPNGPLNTPLLVSSSRISPTAAGTSGGTSAPGLIWSWSMSSPQRSIAWPRNGRSSRSSTVAYESRARSSASAVKSASASSSRHTTFAMTTNRVSANRRVSAIACGFSGSSSQPALNWSVVASGRAASRTRPW